jgi:subtilase family serine protease
VDSVQQGSEADGTARTSAHPKAFRRLALPAAVLSIALGATQLAAAVPSEASTASSSRVAVGHAPALPKGATHAAAPAASTKLTLDVGLQTGHSAELEAYAAGVGNRNSPYYHQYLTPKQVAQYFGASPAQISAVEAQLSADGLSVGPVASDGMFISVTGTVAQAEHAFGVTIAGYSAAGRTFYANTSAPTLPAAVSGDVSQIVGLDDIAYATPQYTTQNHLEKVGASSSAGANATSNYSVNSCSNIASVLNPRGYFNGNGYYDANTVSGIYGFNSKLAAGDDGAGVTVALFELESYDPAGVADIDSCYHHSTSVTEQKIDGGPTTGANMALNVGVESALDIENIANLAPGVKIVDYAGPNYTVATDAQILDIFSAIFNQDTAQVVSTSWGLCEPLTQLGDSAMEQAENTLFAQAAAQGQTVVAASGDNGSTSCFGEDTDGTDGSVTGPDDPSDQPFVTGVGGTTMSGLGTPTPAVWNDAINHPTDSSPGASGGGVSTYFGLPSYQGANTTSAPGYSANCSDPSGCREDPDVSALADPYQGYVIEEYAHDDSHDIPADEYYNIIGGTSGAAPVWAAVFALTDASTSCRLNGGAGFVNPSLYAANGNSSVFTDVTSGDNWIPSDGGSDYYAAATGYDLATGWGTPKVSGVASTVCQAPIVSPSSYFVADGPTRVLNTRNGTGGVTGPIKASGVAKLQLTGTNGVPAANVTAVVLNVTVADGTGGGYVTVYPDKTSRPVASNLNFSKGEAIPNLVTVPVGSDGAVDLFNGSGGTVSFIADLEGYYTTDSTASGASTYVADGPTRVLDTRKGTGGVTGPIAVGGQASLKLAGVAGVPADATGVVMNVTVANPTGGGYATVYPDLTPRPTTSNVNFSKGEAIPNLVTVPLGSNGNVDFYNGSNGTVAFVADLEGYYTPGTSGAKYHALAPIRLVDTRLGEGETSVAPLNTAPLTLALPSSYSAVITNITVTAPVGGGYVSAYPIGGNPTASSNVNFSAGETIPNLAIVTSNNGVSFSDESTGATQLVVDLEGYFSAS